MTKSTVLSSYKLFAFIFIFRLANSFAIETFSKRMSFSSFGTSTSFVYGYGYLTWEWKQQLRSAIHPLIYVLGYKLVGDNTTLVRISPKVINALIAAIGEYNLYKFIIVYDSEKLAWITLMLSLFNPFNGMLLQGHFQIIWKWFSPCWHYGFGHGTRKLTGVGISV